MADIQSSTEISKKKIILKIYLLLVTVLSISTMVNLVRIRGEGNGFLGLSGERLFLAAIPLGVSLYSAVLSCRAFWKPDWLNHFQEVLNRKLKINPLFGALIILGTLGILNGLNFRLWISEIDEPVTLAFYVRLLPVMSWFGALSALTLVTIHLLRYGWKPETSRSILYPFSLISACFLTLWVWVSQSRVGLSPIDQGIGWIPLGIPLLETQILLAWFVTLIMMALSPWLFNQRASSWFGKVLGKKGVVGFLLWAVAFGVWISQPLKPNWFAAEARPPNMVAYPNSDASVYDITAQNLLLGEGFKTRGSPYTIRPLYGFLLATFHAIGGLDYEPIIWMQVALLALIPTLLYALTTRIHNSYSGILVALLFILRERNAIIMGDTISDAHAKLLMPFMPTALGVLLITIVMVAWMKDPERRKGLPLVSGGFVGIFMLVRPEIVVLFPFVGLAALFHLKGRPRLWAKAMGFMLLGLALALSPWIWRNYQYTGTVFLDSPYYRLDLISRRYQEEPIGFVDPALLEQSTASPEPAPKPTIIPEEEATATQEPEASPVDDDPASRWLKSILEFVKMHPMESLNFIVKHFMNSTIQTVQAISPTYPFTFSVVDSLGHGSLSQFWFNCCSLEEYDRGLPYWYKWDGKLHAGTILPMGVNLALIALGISVVWVKQRYIGMVPMFVAMGYILVNALVRNSGGRYLIPVNWVALFYLSIGLVQISGLGIDFIRKQPVLIRSMPVEQDNSAKSEGARSVSLSQFWIALVILLVGISLPVVERSIPAKQSADLPETRLRSLLESQDSILSTREQGELSKFLERGGSVLSGAALYPRFHKPNEMGSTWYFYEDRPYSNLDFYLSSPGDVGIVLPRSQSPAYLPHASQVLVFACTDIPDFRALAVVIYDDSGEAVEILWRDPMVTEPGCPLQKGQ